ncbi:hypothetical protein SAMN05216436_13116 [bacterium A37T11]|nr:hypothetical protein SAMN05216436_13116 [bacterium A37T11]
MLKNISEDLKVYKYFTAMYLVALFILAVLLVLSHLLTQRYLSHQLDDSHIVNFAGRLRTYSQTLSKTALLIESGRDVSENTKEFSNTLNQWEKSHQGLLTGNTFLNLPANNREDISQMFEIISRPHLEIWKAASKMLSVLQNGKPFDVKQIEPYIHTILAYERSYLLGMELIVFDYDRFSREKITNLKNLQHLILALSLLLLGAEVMVIFKPLSLRIKHTIKGLLESEETSKKLAEQVQQAIRDLEKSHNELREMTFALEKATYLVKTDRTGKIIYANDKYCHVTRYPLSELLSKPLFHNQQTGRENDIYKHLQDPIRKQEVWQGEVFDHAFDGTGFWLDAVLMPVFDQSGKVYQYMMIGNDITLRKQTEQKLMQLTKEKMAFQNHEQKIRSYAIISGQEKERKRIAAEIHDGIGQMLTSLRMKMEQLEDKQVGIDGEVGTMNNMLYQVINETKRICSDLLPSVLDDFGLLAAIRALIKSCQDAAPHIAFNLEDALEMTPLDKEVEIGVFRVLQESLHNAMKHAEATVIDIHVNGSDQYLNLMVQDNGRGFYFDHLLLSKAQTKKANGLRNMKERAELLGGELLINSQPGLGTSVQLEVTLAHEYD